MISDFQATGGSGSNSLKESESLKVLRAVRVLRPLKIVSGIPSECQYIAELQFPYAVD